MKRTVRRVSVTQTTETSEQAVEISMQPQELDSIGRLVLTEKQGGIFTPSVDADIEGFRRTMIVMVRENGMVTLVPAHRRPSMARELAKTPHGKVSQMECGDVVVTFRFASSLIGKITPTLFDEAAKIILEIEKWENLVS